MKKKLLCFLGMLVAVVLSTVMSSCEYVHDHGGQFSSADSTAIATIAQQEVTPTFSTPAEAQAYQMDIASEFQSDSVFRAMSQKQLFDVTSVLLGRGIHPTAKQIADEFTKNKDVYSNLPKEPQAEEDKPIPPVQEGKDTIVDTIIDGHKVHIIKNKEE